MKTTISVIIAVLCAFATASSASARGPYGSITVGNWRGGAYTNDKTGAFSHCAAGVVYDGGVSFVVSIGEDSGWRLGFAHDSWQLTPGENFALALTFDGQQAINVPAMPIGGHLVNVQMPANSMLIAQFRKAKVMTAYAQGQLIQLNLTQTAQLLPARWPIASSASRKTGSSMPASSRWPRRSRRRRPRRLNRILERQSPPAKAVPAS